MWRPRIRRLAVGGGLVAIGAVVVGLMASRWAGRPKGPPGSPERAIAEQCRPLPREQRQDCYLGALERRMTEVGVGAAMATLDALAANDPEVEQEGHVYAHGVGIKGYLHLQDVAATFGQCPTDFSSGCGHGAIQAYLESQEALDDQALNALCAPYRDPFKARWQLFQCVHGMGHGLLMMLGGDLLAALANCDRLTEVWDQSSCHGGAFMENIMGATAPHHPATELTAGHEHHQAFKAIDSTDLLYPCSIVADRFLRACYQIQTAAILHFTKGQIKPASQACDRAPEALQPTCYLSLGRDISSKARRDPGRVVRYCEQAGERHRPWCFYGAAKALIDWNAEPGAGIALCRRLGQRPGEAMCFMAVGEELAALGKPMTERESICRTTGAARAVAACGWGAAIPGTVPPTDVGLVTTFFPAPPATMSGPGTSANPPAARTRR